MADLILADDARDLNDFHSGVDVASKGDNDKSVSVLLEKDEDGNFIIDQIQYNERKP